MGWGGTTALRTEVLVYQRWHIRQLCGSCVDAKIFATKSTPTKLIITHARKCVFIVLLRSQTAFALCTGV